MNDFMKNFIKVITQESSNKFGDGEMEDLVIHFFERFEEEGIKEDIKNNNSEYFDTCFKDDFIYKDNFIYKDDFIYYDDLWMILKFYQLPQDANFYEAMDLFYNDLREIYTNI